MSNQNLNAAIKARYDEFYTLSATIEKELSFYTQEIQPNQCNHFRDKTVFCNCDDPEYSNFWKYFVTNFEKIGLRKVISTHFEFSGDASYKLEYTGNKDEHGVVLFSKTKLNGNGDFRSDECRQILDEADIIVTNPPFSLFREYVRMLIEHGKQFLIIGNMNALKYKDIFPYMKERKMWLGVNNGAMIFRVPEEFDRNNVFIKDEIKYAKFGNICWYTNLEHYKIHELLPLTSTYHGNEEKYPKYDTYDAIEIGKIKEIPADYDGIMAVPITILLKLNPEQFEIVGEFNHGCDNEYDLAAPVINGKQKFPRIAIRRLL